MHLVPVLVLLVFPTLYLAWRLRLGEHRGIRLLGGTVLAAVVLWSLPYEGIEFQYVKRLNLFIAAAVVLLLLGRHWRLVGLGQPKRLVTILALAALLSVTTYFNFFTFHGERTFIHLHDAAHYYLGAKYYAETGYEDLYVAMLRAESDHYDGQVLARSVRDLRTYEETLPTLELEQRGPQVKGGFTAERWNNFSRDVVFFRQSMKHQYAGVLVDHGFNATPVWVLFGSALSRLVPAGSETGILLICLVDIALLAGLIVAISWAFGPRTALLSVILYCVVFGANFGWTGGGFLRNTWLFSLGVGVCCLKKRRDAAAGSLFALATMLRIFPLFFVVPLAFKALHLVWRRQIWRGEAWRNWRSASVWPRRQFAFFISFGATAVLLFALTGLLPRGYQHWSEFRHQMDLHVANISPNMVGLTDLLAFRPGAEEQVTQEEFNDLKQRRKKIHNGQLLLIFVPILLLVARLSRFSTDMACVAMALPLVHASLSLAGYYQVFLIVLVLWQYNSMHNLALLFVVEAASHSLLLFENRDALLFIYRSVLLLFLYVALFLPHIRREMKNFRL